MDLSPSIPRGRNAGWTRRRRPTVPSGVGSETQDGSSVLVVRLLSLPSYFACSQAQHILFFPFSFLSVWALHGVWEPSTSTLLKPHYFQTSPANPTRPISFVPDYWRPAWELWARGIRKEHPECIHFIQPPVFHPPPELDEEDLRGRACVSCHFYDGLTLL
jgi:hypothetical protein